MLCDLAVINLFKKVIWQDGYIELPAQGNSMFPLIHKGDICRFIPFSPTQLKKGDIVLFHKQNGQLIAHRFYEIVSTNGLDHFIFKGDTNLGFDQPVLWDQIIGKMKSIQKQNSKLSIEERYVFLWTKLILTFPILSGLLRKYLNWKSVIQY